jgi:hypothetical protein
LGQKKMRQKKTMSQVFISYSKKDRTFVEQLATELYQEGIKVIYDQLIAVGAPWAETLSKVIEDSDFIVSVFSPDYIESRWAMEEMRQGLLRDVEGKAQYIPIIARACELPEEIHRRTYADFTENYDFALKRLINAIKGGGDPVDALLGAERSTKTQEEIAPLLEQLRKSAKDFRAQPEERSHTERGASDGDGKICFIVMPFSDEDLQVVYEDFVKPTVIAEGFQCERGDDVFGSNVVMDDILSSIETCDMVIADLTRKNANVFYEVGIAHTLKKPVLLLAQSIEDVPFDLRHRRILLYEYNPRGCKKLERTLPDNLKAMERDRKQGAQVPKKGRKARAKSS